MISSTSARALSTCWPAKLTLVRACPTWWFTSFVAFTSFSTRASCFLAIEFVVSTLRCSFSASFPKRRASNFVLFASCRMIFAVALAASAFFYKITIKTWWMGLAKFSKFNNLFAETQTCASTAIFFASIALRSASLSTYCVSFAFVIASFTISSISSRFFNASCAFTRSLCTSASNSVKRYCDIYNNFKISDSGVCEYSKFWIIRD